MGMKKTTFGKLSTGETVYLVTVVNQNGMSMEVTDYGATLVSLVVPDGKGRMDDVLLGFEDVKEYESDMESHGATVGRVANRIGGASFVLNGVEYRLDANEGKNMLHGGFDRYNKRVWEMELLEEQSAVRFRLNSPHLDQGFPGNFQCQVTYTLTEDNELRIDYEGSSDQDTLVNMTNHSYFNLNGQESEKNVENHWIRILSDAFTPVDQELIPTGEIRPVDGTPLDFREAKIIGRDLFDTYEQMELAGGYDHNFILKDYDGTVKKAGEVWVEESGRLMEIFTDCPAMQLYTGNFLDGTHTGKEGAVYGKRSGLALETQFCPDAVHHENFKSPVLKAGDLYRSTTIYRFGVK